jgi:hypothetical protein
VGLPGEQAAGAENVNLLAWLAGSRAGRTAAAAFLALAGFGLALLRAFSAGKAHERAKDQAATLKILQSRLNTDDEIARLSPDDRRELLRGWVQRDDE